VRYARPGAAGTYFVRVKSIEGERAIRIVRLE
jgi:hypothetical protein